MKGFLKSKLSLSLAAFVMIASVIVVALPGTLIRIHAQGSIFSFTAGGTLEEIATLQQHLI